MSIQKPGYPNISVKLYENYDAWKENRFAELASTLTTLTLRDGLYGRNEGILQFHDTKIMHTYLNGEQIIQISVANANSENVLNRIYGSKHFSTSVDEKGDNIIAIELAPIHQLENLKFSRCFFSNAEESISEMIRVIYRDRQLIAPKINGLNISVPRVPWTYGIKEYMDYIREVGIGVDSENFVFVWEDFRGVNMMDYPQLTNQEAVKMVVGEPRLIGQYQDRLEVPLAYDFVWLTKANQHTRNPMENVTIYSYSFADQGIERLTIGDGSNSIMVNRSGGYADMTFRNGYEEGMRLLTMAQYDGYATCKLAGNFEIMPGTKINFGDMKGQFKTDFYVDEVIHEISNNTSITNLYMFTNGKEIKEIQLEKVKTVPPTTVVGVTDNTDGVTEGTTEQGVATGSKSGSDWDLDKLASVVTANARGRSSTGDCALYVRKALQQAQLKKFFSGGLGHANQMGPNLTRMGWKIVGANVSSWRKGDIVIFQKTNTKLGQKYGHVAIFNGSQWVSDFIQNSVQPNRTSTLPYTLYRAVNPYTAG